MLYVHAIKPYAFQVLKWFSFYVDVTFFYQLIKYIYYKLWYISFIIISKYIACYPMNNAVTFEVINSLQGTQSGC